MGYIPKLVLAFDFIAGIGKLPKKPAGRYQSDASTKGGGLVYKHIQKLEKKEIERIMRGASNSRGVIASGNHLVRDCHSYPFVERLKWIQKRLVGHQSAVLY